MELIRLIEGDLTLKEDLCEFMLLGTVLYCVFQT